MSFNNREFEPRPNPLEHASDAIRSETSPQTEVLYGAMLVGFLSNLREDIQREIKPLPRKVVDEAFIDGPEISGPLNKTDVQPDKWYQTHLNKQNKQ